MERKLSLIKLDNLLKEKSLIILNEIVYSMNLGEVFEDYKLAVLFLKEKIFEQKSPEELFFDKDHFLECINSLDNKIRREILGIVFENRSIKAEAIRSKINMNSSKKYTLTSVIKHLNILTKSKLLRKTNRLYEADYQRIILNIPINWLAKE